VGDKETYFFQNLMEIIRIIRLKSQKNSPESNNSLFSQKSNFSLQITSIYKKKHTSVLPTSYFFSLKSDKFNILKKPKKNELNQNKIKDLINP
jgi:hypothetical protein